MEFIFYPYLDSPGNDINSQTNQKQVAKNSLGFSKYKVDFLEPTPYINSTNGGIYILKDYPIPKNLYLLDYQIGELCEDIFKPYRLSTNSVTDLYLHKDDIWKQYFPNLGKGGDNILIADNFNNFHKYQIILSFSNTPDIDGYDIYFKPFYQNNVKVYIKKRNIVYVRGISGLANNMFQIAVAIYYAEKYGCKILLDYKSETLKYGTSNQFDRDTRRRNGLVIESYFDNIFKNFDIIDYSKNLENVDVVYNNNECYQIVPDKSILIQGFSQNVNLFLEYMPVMEKYFHFSDPEILNYIHKKYRLNEELNDEEVINLCIGIRIGKDFQHMKKITSSSYNKAFHYFTKDCDKKIRIFVLSDVKNCDMLKELHKIYSNIEIILVEEDDITQFYVGLECDSFILSESTFHYWIALLAYYRDKKRKVLVFNDTDLTNRPLALKEWIKIDY